MPMKLSPLAAAFAAAALLTPLAAGAQTSSTSLAPPAAATPAAPGPAANVSDQQITQAAVAMRKVMDLRQTYDQRMDQAKPEDRGRVAEEGQTAMKQAVANQGLSVERYNAILQLAQNDPNVRAKLLSRVPQPGNQPNGATAKPPSSNP
ncbi:MAG: DUF4168 domain-containing protein [Stellaceae bacterium]